MSEVEVISIPLDEIEVVDRAREDLGDLEGLRESIREKGLLQPITVSFQAELDSAKPYRLIAGGRRYYAHAEEQIPEILAIVRHVADTADARELELIENIHRKDLTWQERVKLTAEIYTLRKSTRATASVAGVSPMTVSRHVQAAELIEKFPDLAKLKTEADLRKAIHSMEEEVVVAELARRAEARLTEAPAGDWSDAEEDVRKQIEALPDDVKAYAWAHAAYRLGDAIYGMEQCDSEIANFAEVDPPYGIDLNELKRKGDLPPAYIDMYQEIEKEGYPAFVRMVAGSIWRLLQDDSFMIWWFGPTHYSVVKDNLIHAGFFVSEVPAIWNKGSQGQTMQPDYNLANCYEMFFVCRKGKPVIRTPGRSNVFTFAPVPGQHKYHSTQRPVELLEEIIKVFCYPTTRAVVPFLGSGTTLLALHRANMQGFGWDLSKEIKNRFLLRVQEEA